jgi:hypothetical protein
LAAAKTFKLAARCKRKAIKNHDLGRGQHSDMQAVARNVWLWTSIYDIEVEFQHIQGTDNVIADLLSRWASHSNPDSALYTLLNDQPVWFYPSETDLILELDI